MRKFLFAVCFVLPSLLVAQKKKPFSDKNLEAALSSIDGYKSSTLADHIALTQIPAPPFKESKRGQRFFDMLQAAGADSVWIDAVGNVYALRKGTKGGKVVVVEGHLDTVFPESTDVTVNQKGDTLYAPGIADDTRALAVIVTLVRVLRKQDLRTQHDLWFVGTVGEEGLGDLRGVKHLFKENRDKIKSMISLEPVDGVVTNGLGSIRYRVIFKGPGGHSNGNFGIVNPIHALGKAIDGFSAAAEAHATKNDVTFNVGVIKGGTSVNSISFEASMEVDMRSGDPQQLKIMDSLLKSQVSIAVARENKVKRSGPDLQVELVPIGNRPTGKADMQSGLMKNLQFVFQQEGLTPHYETVSTNANIPFSLGIPAVCISSGGQSAHHHSLNEWWLPTNAEAAVKRALKIILLEAGY